jgi:hypothetical protein
MAIPARCQETGRNTARDPARHGLWLRNSRIGEVLVCVTELTGGVVKRPSSQNMLPGADRLGARVHAIAPLRLLSRKTDCVAVVTPDSALQ